MTNTTKYLATLTAMALLATPVAAATGVTTLQTTIAAQEDGTLIAGPGEERTTRTLGWNDPGGSGRKVFGFKQLSDVHVVDEESPGRLEYFDQCEQLNGHSSAYRPQEAFATQVGNSMLKQLAPITKGPATGVPLSFVVSTGDNVDNNQLNETRWFIELMNGQRVEPNSGAATYDGYTKEHFSGAVDTELLELAQQPFRSVGAKGPWYAVLGNHDGLVQGTSPASLGYKNLVIGNKKVFFNIDTYDNCPTNATEASQIAVAAILGSGTTVPADPDRIFLSHEELVDEYLASSGKPTGHGLARAPQDPLHGSRAGYYSFPMGPKVKGISLDTISPDGGATGTLPHPQFKWLRRQLTKSSKRYYNPAGELRRNRNARNKLVVVFSHHTSESLNNPGTNEAGAPYHCFRSTDTAQSEAATCAGGEGLGDLLARYPNAVAWVNGHEHNNAIRDFPAPAGTNPARGFWEINTASHIDWPQQSRLIELAWKPARRGPGTVIIYTTAVDHSADLAPDRANQSTPDFLASVSRLEAYRDACIRVGQATCAANGEPGDRNTRLISKAPFKVAP